ncbi:hypothetical protein CY35_04G071300 [Sphagnum magellanicum]|nr:hypothetical protein CY35_04G071300 [Sphagnum magellanicum]
MAKKNNHVKTLAAGEDPNKDPSLVAAAENLETKMVVASVAPAVVVAGDGAGDPASIMRLENHGVAGSYIKVLDKEKKKVVADRPLRSMWSELQKQCWLAGPTFLTLMLNELRQLMVVSFVAQLGASYLAAYSLGNSFVFMIGFDSLIGLASGLETLCGQAYGAKEYHLLRIYLRRGVFVLLIAALPISLAVFYMAPILVAFGENTELAAHAQVFGRWLIPSLVTYTFLSPLVNFCQCQHMVVSVMWAEAVAFSLQLPICFLLITKLKIGYQAGAVAFSTAVIFEALALATIVRFSSKGKKVFSSFSMHEVLHDMVGFLKLAVPAAGMTCLERWTYQILSLLAGLLPHSEIELAAFTISVSLLALTKLPSTALSVSASVRVSNELGAGRPHAAKFSVFMSIMMSMGVGIIMAAMVLLPQNVWGHAFSKEQEVLDRVSMVAPYLAAVTILNCIQVVLSGVMRGIGLQKVGAYTNLGAYYGVGLATAMILIFVFQFDGRGLWIGMLCGVMAQTVALTTISLFLNWESLSKEALKRICLSQSSLPSTTVPLLAEDKATALFTSPSLEKGSC